jgi:hypothetical protein
MGKSKAEEQKAPDSAWNRTRPGEPVFVLCGRDQLAPEIVDEWAKRAELAGVVAAKVERARALANTMRDWQREIGPSKLPDYVEGEES